MNYFSKSVLTIMAAGISLSSFAQTAVKEGVPKGWHLEDLKKDGYYGISLDQAYDFVKGKNSKPVVVAVIDSGIDTTQEDLKSVLWTNPNEIPGNGIDDDKNGYVDDVHGWNFLGGKDGRDVSVDSDEGARVYHEFKSKFENLKDTSSLSPDDLYDYNMWKRAERQINGYQKNSLDLLMLRRTYSAAATGDSVLQKEIGKKTYTGTDLNAFTPTSDEAKKAKSVFMYFFKANNAMDMTNESFLSDFKEYLSGEERKAQAATTAPEDYRGEIVKDNYNDINDRYYGNNDIMSGTPMHGTHVSGIIAADRNNGIGVKGIADNVKIMMVRAVPDGDEHDKDVALAIRYAVDNGAKVINMSFGKSFSPQKNWVDSAVKYAESKGVLLVHAAGNDGANVDSTFNFPTPHFKNDTTEATDWITVGASGDPKGQGLVADFSNYGKKEVDVFAPGVQIYSSLPGGNKYGNLSGTSMASPVVAGLAAFVWEYYPNLTVQQLKYVIENSTVAPDINVTTPITNTSVSLADISKSGGIVNAYEAVKLADRISKDGNAAGQETKMKVKQKHDKKKIKTEESKKVYKPF